MVSVSLGLSRPQPQNLLYFRPPIMSLEDGRTTRCHSETEASCCLQASCIANLLQLLKVENGIPKYECRGYGGQGYILQHVGILQRFGWFRYSAALIRTRVHGQRNAECQCQRMVVPLLKLPFKPTDTESFCNESQRGQFLPCFRWILLPWSWGCMRYCMFTWTEVLLDTFFRIPKMNWKRQPRPLGRFLEAFVCLRRSNESPQRATVNRAAAAGTAERDHSEIQRTESAYF